MNTKKLHDYVVKARETLDELDAEIGYVEPPPPPTETVIALSASGNIAGAAQQLASTGGAIELVPGATYPPVTLPPRAAGAPRIAIRTRGTFPTTRVTEAERSSLATIAGEHSYEGAVRLEGASGYLLQNLALTMPPGQGAGEVVVIQESDNVTLDRVLCVVPGGMKRIVRGNGTKITVTRSLLDGGAWQGQDSQAFFAGEGAGPYTIVDNTLIASGENILFGGDDNYRHNGADNPADILVQGNLLFKRPEWRSLSGTVKNLFELKNATRATIRGNRFENVWTDAQNGYAVLFTPLNQDGRAPWTVVKDVLFENNLILGAENGINISGYGHNGQVTQQATGIVIRNNVVITTGRFLQIGNEVGTLTLDDTISDNGYNIADLYKGDIPTAPGVTRPGAYAVGNLTWTNSVHRDNGRMAAGDDAYGIHGDATACGTPSLAAFAPSYVFTGNKLQGMRYPYPTGTTAIDEAAFQAAKAAKVQALGLGGV